MMLFYLFHQKASFLGVVQNYGSQLKQCIIKIVLFIIPFLFCVVQQPLSSSNFLFELDRVTQDVLMVKI